MKILRICGSLRKNSSNRGILISSEKLVSNVHWLDFDISGLPFFDPDNQYSETITKVVLEFRQLARECRTLLISTPEYVHGEPGVLKNVLEWLFHVGTQKKSVFLVIAAGQGELTLHHLIEFLQTMDFSISFDQNLQIQGICTKVTSEGVWPDKVL